MAKARKNSIKKNKKPGRKTRVVIRRGGSRKMNLKGGAAERYTGGYGEPTQEMAAQALLGLANKQQEVIEAPIEAPVEATQLVSAEEIALRTFYAKGVRDGTITGVPSQCIGMDPEKCAVFIEQTSQSGGDFIQINNLANSLAKRFYSNQVKVEPETLRVFLLNNEVYEFYQQKLSPKLRSDHGHGLATIPEGFLARVLEHIKDTTAGIRTVCVKLGQDGRSHANCLGENAVQAYIKIKKTFVNKITSFSSVQIIEFLIHCGLSISVIWFSITTIIPLLISGGMSLGAALVYIIRLFTTPIVGGVVAAAGAAFNNPNTAFAALIFLNAAIKKEGSTFKIRVKTKLDSAIGNYEAIKREILEYLNERYTSERILGEQLEDRDAILDVVADGVRTPEGGPIALNFKDLNETAVQILEDAIDTIPPNSNLEQAANYVIDYVNRATESKNASSASIALHYLVNSTRYMQTAYTNLVRSAARGIDNGGRNLYRIGREERQYENRKGRATHRNNNDRRRSNRSRSREGRRNGQSGGARKVRGTRKNLRIKSKNSNSNKNKNKNSKKRKSRK